MLSMRIVRITLLAATITAGTATLTTLTSPSGASTSSIWQTENTVNPKATALGPHRLDLRQRVSLGT